MKLRACTDFGVGPGRTGPRARVPATCETGLGARSGDRRGWRRRPRAAQLWPSPDAAASEQPSSLPSTDTASASNVAIAPPPIAPVFDGLYRLDYDNPRATLNGNPWPARGQPNPQATGGHSGVHLQTVGVCCDVDAGWMAPTMPSPTPKPAA